VNDKTHNDKLIKHTHGKRLQNIHPHARVNLDYTADVDQRAD
jgi:hypothetical protein